MASALFIATILRIGMVVVSYGAKVPAGIFVPSMAIGATFGRMLGIMVKALWKYVCPSEHRGFILIIAQSISDINYIRGLPARRDMHHTWNLCSAWCSSGPEVRQ